MHTELSRESANAPPRIWSLLLLLAFLATMLLLPVWVVRYPPLVDYPDHLARSFILVHLKDPAYSFGAFYSSDWGPYPYLGMDLSLIGLQQLLPVETAGRVLLSFCALAVPIAGWWFLRQANPGHDALALWVLLLSFGPFFLGGFLNSQLGMALSFCTLGFWLRYLQNASTLRWLGVLVLVTCCYFTHLIAFGVTAFVVAVYLLARRVELRQAAWSCGAFVPGLVLLSLSRIIPSNGGQPQSRTFVQKFSAARDALLLGYSHRLEIVTLWILAICILAAWVRNREFQWNRTWLVVVAAVLAVYMMLPNGWGQSWFIDVRLIPWLFLFLLCAAKIGRRQRALALAALALFSLRMADVVRSFRAQQPELWHAEQAIQMLPRNVRVLPIVNVDTVNDDLLHQVYNHVWAYAVIERGVRAPYLFDFRGQTPLRVNSSAYLPAAPADDPDTRPPDWQKVEINYEYVWTYNADYYQNDLLAVGNEIYHAGSLRLYRLKKRSE